MWRARTAVLPLAVWLAGCAGAVPVRDPQGPGTARLFRGERVVGHYVSPVAYHHFLEAQLASLDGRSDEAVDELRRALASDGESAYLRTRLAEELLALGRMDEARDELETAIRLDPSFAEAHVDLGRIQLRLGDVPGAEGSFHRALDADRESEEACFALASLYRERGEGGRADQLYRGLIERAPGSASAHQRLAGSLRGSGDLAGAERELRRALAIDPSLVEARRDLGELLFADGRVEGAAEELKVAFQRSDRDLRLAAQLHLALLRAERPAEAQALLDRLRDGAHSTEQWIALGWLYLALHQVAPARELVDAEVRAKKADPPSSVRLLAGAVLAESGDAEGALAEWARIPAGSPDYASALARSGAALRDAGRLDAAVASFERALAAAEPEARDVLLRELADAEERRGHRERAVDLLERALTGAGTLHGAEAIEVALAGLVERGGDPARAGERLRALSRRVPDSAVGLRALGELQGRFGRAAESQKLLERAFALDPMSAGGAAALGRAALAAGRLDEAQRLLERAERLAPDDPAVLAQLGDVYLRRNLKAPALALFRRAADRRPDGELRRSLEEKLLILERGRVGAR